MGKKIAVSEGDVYYNLTILRDTGNKRVGRETKRTVDVVCGCGREFNVILKNLKNGNTKSCGCGGRGARTSQQRVAWLRRVLGKKKIIVLTEDIMSRDSDVRIRCTVCLHERVEPYTYFLKKRAHKCVSCAASDRLSYNTERYKTKISQALRHTTLELKTESDFRSVDNVDLTCYDCRRTITRRASSIWIDKRGCPCKTKGGFKQNKPAWLYLLEVKSTNNLLFYKYGVTNNLSERLLILFRNKSCSFRLVGLWEYAEGVNAVRDEKVLKQTFPRFADKEWFPDGWTETVDKRHLEELMEIQQNQYKGGDVGPSPKH